VFGIARKAITMDISEPARSLAPTLHLTVLAALVRTTHPMSGRGLARLLDGKASQRGVADALKHLVSQGLVIRENHPPSASFRLNRDHIAAGVAELLGELKDALRQRCSLEVSSWETRPAWAAFFGSVARGEGDENSDIDIALVLCSDTEPLAPEWTSQVERLAERTQAWTGNRASIIAFGHDEWLDSTESLVEEIAREGITIWGHRPDRRPR